MIAQNLPFDVIGVILEFVVRQKSITPAIKKYCDMNDDNGFLFWFYIIFKREKYKYDVFETKIITLEHSKESSIKNFNEIIYVDVFRNESYFVNMTCELVLYGFLTSNTKILEFFSGYIQQDTQLKKSVNKFIDKKIGIIKENVYGVLLLEEYNYKKVTLLFKHIILC